MYQFSYFVAEEHNLSSKPLGKRQKGYEAGKGIKQRQLDMLPITLIAQKLIGESQRSIKSAETEDQRPNHLHTKSAELAA
jgi:hypothetical protein